MREFFQTAYLRIADKLWNDRRLSVATAASRAGMELGWEPGLVERAARYYQACQFLNADRRRSRQTAVRLASRDYGWTPEQARQTLSDLNEL